MTILQALKSYYDRVAEREPGTIAADGYSDEKISFAIVIGNDGRYVDVSDLRQHGEKRPQPALISVPASFKRPGVTPRSFFLWDKTAFALGVTRGATSEQRFVYSPAQHDAFRRLHLSKLEGVDDPGLLALRRFIESWSPDKFAKLQHAEEMTDANIVFRLSGEGGFIHDRPAARNIWSRVRAETDSQVCICLVTGARAPIARLHPAIKGVKDAQSAGASIVSFNLDAFTSYGFEQGDNAPVSENAAFGYTTALNKLLRSGSKNRIQLADATTVFWAEAPDAEQAEAAEDFFSYLSAPPDDEAVNARMRRVMQLLAQGRPLHDPTLHLADGTEFYILGLAPNAARISVRFWHRTTLGELGRRFHQHWQDLRINGVRWKQPPAIWQLLTRTAPGRRSGLGQVKYDTKQIPPNLAGEVMRAILTGVPYPRTLLANLLMRLRSDRVADGLRIALIKACLVREMRLRNPDMPKEEYVSLNRDDTDAAYRLGRLFAVLERSQEAALDGVNATIRDRFYGSASATPAAVFPILIRNGMHHLAGLRKGRGARWVKKPAATGYWLAHEMGEILNGLDRDWPKSFTMEAQGRFAMGYFHQKFARREDAPDDLQPDPTIDDTTDAAEEQE